MDVNRRGWLHYVTVLQFPNSPGVGGGRVLGMVLNSGAIEWIWETVWLVGNVTVCVWECLTDLNIVLSEMVGGFSAVVRTVNCDFGGLKLCVRCWNVLCSRQTAVLRRDGGNMFRPALWY
jgi:hypothetical protein